MKSVNDVLSATVYSDAGDEVGKIDDIILDESSGKIEFLSIQPLREKNRMRVRLTWEEIQSKSNSKGFYLNQPKSAAKRLLTR